MPSAFTDDLERSLTDFVANTSDDEFRRGLSEADYAFYSGVNEPVEKLHLSENATESDTASFSPKPN
jgi:hypothetical protein